jgi:hypothetical protein
MVIRYRGNEIPLEWRLYDALGRLRLRQNGGFELGTNTLEPNVYMVEIEFSNNKFHREKWVKEN